MKIVFYQTQNKRVPVKEFINQLEVSDRAKLLGCLKNIEELGFEASRVEFRQINAKLWEIKVRVNQLALRVFYVLVKKNMMVLLHVYKKQSQKAPDKEIKTAQKRLKEVLENESDYFG